LDFLFTDLLSLIHNSQNTFSTTVGRITQFEMVQIKTVVTTLLSLSLATCNPIVQRDAATVLADLATIGTDLGTLTTAVTAYTGGLTGALVVANDENTLDTAINQATTDTTAASAFSTADSTSVVAAVASLTPQIQSGLTALINKVF
jgi:hypothetical protein